MSFDPPLWFSCAACRFCGMITPFGNAQRTGEYSGAAVPVTPETFVTLGAPHSDSDFRYYLNPLDGQILLACLVAENIEIEIVNESLGNFIEFLYRIGRYKAFSEAADDSQQADYKDLLTAYLATLDPGSLKESDNWCPW